MVSSCPAFARDRYAADLYYKEVRTPRRYDIARGRRCRVRSLQRSTRQPRQPPRCHVTKQRGAKTAEGNAARACRSGSGVVHQAARVVVRDRLQQDTC